MSKRWIESLIAAGLAGATTALWFVATLSGWPGTGWHLAPFWMFVIDFWLPVISATLTGAVVWLVASRLSPIPMVPRGVIAGAATALLAPVVFWRVLLQATYRIPGITFGNLEGVFVLINYSGSRQLWAVLVGAVVGGVWGQWLSSRSKRAVVDGSEALDKG